MEEGRSFKKRKNFTYMAVDISPTFTRDYTNGHDVNAFRFNQQALIINNSVIINY
ncbi:hypothetical protein [Okeania sp. SIO1I7]|uniref:hypothetical protein n=1 Tax=Okeania sp. SIO1I7 TaxID=2607772 RepID=UPI0013F7F95D|nr:hypothetical protein [Okeania sp. SIO1I7]NET24520.1 hypothetical protein [Okeania sp. SIO1I7]